MQLCPNCGEENPDQFRLCGFCGSPLAPALPAQEVRKTVTIVFSDLKGSTAMAEKLDSEAVREVLSRYFDEMRGALERHGGTVEKYIGDAIMAVFGLPRVHEDDPLRAVHAAAEMRERLATLNETVERHLARPLVGRAPELAVLVDELASAARGRSCRLVTVVAEAGSGKSRLIEEFARVASPGARVVKGRCLPYGRGITFWPLVEIVRETAAIRDDDPPDAARAKLRAVAGDGSDDVVARVASAIGLGAADFGLDEI